MSLADLQRDFLGMLTDRPNDVGARVAPRAAPGLAIYHNAYRVQLTDCLRDTFEKTLTWLGDEAFNAAARAHIETRPPQGWTLGAYGEGFSDTLARGYPEDPEVVELGWLEWALSRAFEGADAQAATAATLGEVDWDNAVLSFVPTVQLGPAATNAGAIWSALAAEIDPPPAQTLPKPGAVLIWRQDYTPCFRIIEASEEDALVRMMAGMTFGQLCERMIAEHGEGQGVALAAGLLGQWLGEGLIAGAT